MKRVIFSLVAAISVASANPAVMGGVSYKFGASSDKLAGAGLTAKVLSTDKEKKPVVGAGVSFYPWAKADKKFGLDVSAGYNFSKGAVMGGWDFLQNQPSVSLGYNKGIKTDDDSTFVKGIQDARCSAKKKKESNK
jgi:hypothetical protein